MTKDEIRAALEDYCQWLERRPALRGVTARPIDVTPSCSWQVTPVNVHGDPLCEPDVVVVETK